MLFSKQKLLTIITESRLEKTLSEDIEKLGAHGLTITDARGKGSRGVRNATWGANANIRIEIICDNATAQDISEYLKKNYFNNYAMVVFLNDTHTLRTDKF